MAFEFHYVVDLSIVHANVDPVIITRQITELRPEITARAGDPSRDCHGQVRLDQAGEPRIVKVSTWSARLHEQQRLWSGDEPFGPFLQAWAVRLARHRDLFLELAKEGEVRFRIGWFSDTSHSAELMNAESIRALADAGLGLELNFYGPSE